jgi:diadenosine tetraphosphate (Ap4A) HIT family hydrolase
MHALSMDPMALPSDARRLRLRPLLGALAYVKHGRSRCFVCATAARDAGYDHHVVYEDDIAVAFLAKWPPIWGHVLVAPKEHREHVVADFSTRQYLELQAVVHAVGAAVSRAVPCERLYILSLGSQQLNRHVHWHLAPLPPGVPLRRQQFRAFSRLFAGEIDCPPERWSELAGRLRAELRSSGSL